MISFLLLFIGLLLILIEFYIPGAIIGIIGSFFVLASIIVFVSQSASILEIILFVVGVVISLLCIVRFALWRIVKAKPGYSIYSDGNQEGFQASRYDAAAIGKKGIVLSDLKPGGYILIDGQQHQAISQAGYISKGSEVIVLSGQEESLIVKQSKKETIA
ncbi:MAG: NfeD family protein [Parachlamydiaceae bacterium]|nr:NfeD family protein [Parachlamydiaceae bacterium]